VRASKEWHVSPLPVNAFSC